MNKGKNRCRILKEIRRQIAEANDIEFITRDCRYKGDCPGTCPACEAEVRYLEDQISARRLAGKAITLAGISAGMVLMSGCGNTVTSKTLDNKAEVSVTETVMPDTIQEEGEVLEEEILPSDSITATITRAPKAEPVELYFVGEDPTEEKVVVEESDEAEKIYDVVMERPRFPGGEEALFKYIADHIRYPEEAVKNRVEGRLVVQFVVTKTGKIGEIKLMRGKDPDLDREAIRVVKSLPSFIPGKNGNGDVVNCWYVMPVVFTLP